MLRWLLCRRAPLAPLARLAPVPLAAPAPLALLHWMADSVGSARRWLRWLLWLLWAALLSLVSRVALAPLAPLGPLARQASAGYASSAGMGPAPFAVDEGKANCDLLSFRPSSSDVTSNSVSKRGQGVPSIAVVLWTECNVVSEGHATMHRRSSGRISNNVAPNS